MPQNTKSRRLFTLYNFRDPAAKGRLMLLMSSLFANLASVLTAGLFYTGFLINNGINLTNIGIITFIPSMASCMTLLAPSILERFAKRKWVLAGGRAMYYIVYILGGTLVPMFVHNYTAKVVLFCLTVFVGHSFNAIVTSGYTAWHINFLPDEVRAEHFGYNTLVANISCQGFGLLFALIVDQFTGEAAANIIVLLRYVGLAAGLLDVFVLTRPMEFPYGKSSAKPKLRDIFVKPIRNRKYALIMLILFLWNFVSSLPNSVINYYLLEDIGISYSYIQFINFLFPPFVLALMPVCRRLLHRFGWLEVFAYGGVFQGLTFMAYGLVVKGNWMWLFPVVRILQHAVSAGCCNIPWSNFPYMNLPDEDRTDYMSFYILVANISCFLGMMVGTWFISVFPGFSFPLFGVTVGGIQFMLVLNGIGQALLSVFVFKMRKFLRPADGSLDAHRK